VRKARQIPFSPQAEQLRNAIINDKDPIIRSESRGLVFLWIPFIKRAYKPFFGMKAILLYQGHEKLPVGRY
jgi:hypothetical protein